MVESVYRTHFRRLGGLLVRQDVTSQFVPIENSFGGPEMASFERPASSFEGGAVLLKQADERLD